MTRALALTLPGCNRRQPPITVPKFCVSMVRISNCQYPILSCNSPLTGSYRGRPRGGMQLSTWVLPCSASSAASLHEWQNISAPTEIASMRGNNGGISALHGGTGSGMSACQPPRDHITSLHESTKVYPSTWHQSQAPESNYRSDRLWSQSTDPGPLLIRLLSHLSCVSRAGS